MIMKKINPIIIDSLLRMEKQSKKLDNHLVFTILGNYIITKFIIFYPEKVI